MITIPIHAIISSRPQYFKMKIEYSVCSYKLKEFAYNLFTKIFFYKTLTTCR